MARIILGYNLLTLVFLLPAAIIDDLEAKGILMIMLYVNLIIAAAICIGG